jgi:hypothetical protein
MGLASEVVLLELNITYTLRRCPVDSWGLRRRQTVPGNEATPSVLSVVVDTRSRRSGRMPDGSRIVQEANASGNAEDTLTWTRLSGR